MNILPKSFTFTTAEFRERTFRANKPSASGLSETNYEVLRAWYSDADTQIVLLQGTCLALPPGS